MALETEKRNLLIFFGILACILVGTQVFSYRRLTRKEDLHGATSLPGALNDKPPARARYLWCLHALTVL
jgi:hypothetical protein